jgi:hypothetical protein
MPPNKIRRNNMKNYIRLIALALCFGMFVPLAPTSSAQNKGAKLIVDIATA